MCMSCGCGVPNESQGNPDNITMDQMEKAAQASNISVKEAAQNIQNCC